MANTAIQALPYPSLGDAANGPTAIQSLAQAVEKKLVMAFATAAARDAAIPAGTDGMLCYVTGDANWYVWINGKWQAVYGITAGAVAPAATALADQYAYGHTRKTVSGDATWPWATGIVETYRSTTTRTVQWFYGTNGSAYYRFGQDASWPNPWANVVPSSGLDDTGWITPAAAGWAAAANFAIVAAGSNVRKKNGLVSFYINLTSTAGIAAGDAVNVTMFTVPAAYRPTVPQLGGFNGGGSGPVIAAHMTDTGNCVVSATGSAVAAAGTFSVTGTYML